MFPDVLSIYIYFTSMLGVGGILVKKKRRFDASSLFVPETAVEIHSESCRPI